MTKPSIAVVGAGIAGLTCCKILSQAGHNVHLFDKARGPGGRMATRRSPVGNFDHGAQYFAVTDPAFGEEVASWVAAGVAAPWTTRHVRFAGGTQADAAAGETWYCGSPRMSSITRSLSDALPQAVRQDFDCRILSSQRDDQGWWIEDENTRHGPFSHLIMAVPAPQGAEILKDVAGDLAHRLGACEYTPCWALLVCFDQALGLTFDSATSDGIIDWMASDASKPGREPGERWIVHANVPWSVSELERTKEDIAPLLLKAFSALVGDIPEPQSAKAHRWRFARPASFLGEDFAEDQAQQLYAVGDYSRDAGIETAFLSGHRLGHYLLGQIT